MRAVVLALGLTLALAGSAFAHEPRKGPNGGALVDAGKGHVELIANGSPEVTIILSDVNDKPIPAIGYKANAILIIDGKTQRFSLEPGEGSKLIGKAPVAIPAGVKGAVQITAPDGATSQAKF
ncbi:MAG: hypothetical protein ACRCYS_06410 [Beijerinckiaceae bacterium]